MKFIESLNEEKLSLVISCPLNDYEFAKAAWENGADALKVHLNVNHHASGTHFKSLKEEIEFIHKLLKNSPIPVGVVVGGSEEVVDQDFKNVLKENFDFLSLYAHHATTEVLNQDKISKMLACDYTYTKEEILNLEKIGTDILEMSIMHPDDYGTLLTARDLAKYKQINDLVSLPTLLPTQKNIKTSDLQKIKEVGFNGIMIGAIVTTKDYDTYVKRIKEFREAIDAL